MMREILEKLIEERGIELDGKKVLNAQLSMSGGLQLIGAITIDLDEGVGHCVGAIPLNPQNPRAGMKIVEQFFDVNEIQGITVDGKPELMEAYKQLWEQGSTVSGGRSALEI